MKRAVIGVFLILWASSAYFWQARDWNTASRLMLTYAIVDRGTIRIDGMDDQTGDKAHYRGHYYSDKPPGLSFLAVPVYALAKVVLRLPPHPLDRPGFAHWPADYVITLFTSGLVTAITGALLTRFAGWLGCGPRRAVLVGLSYGLATPAWAYATLFYGHQASAACLLGAFALLWREPTERVEMASGLAGFLAASAGLIEVQVGPVSAILGFYALALSIGRKRPWAAVMAFGIGAVGPTLVLLGYHWFAFDSPFRMGYFFEVARRFKDVHSAANPLGLLRPDWSKLDDLLIRPARGLLWYAPVLFLSLPGVISMGMRRWYGMLAVCGATIGAVVLVNLSYPEWTGGWSTGPRLLLPMLPFAMLGVAALLGDRHVEPFRPALIVTAVLLALVGYSIVGLFVGVGARIPDPIAQPLTEAVWPLWRGDRLPPWTFGHRFARTCFPLTGDPRISDDRLRVFFPLVCYQAVAVLILFFSLRNSATSPDDSAPPGLPARPDRP